MPKMIVGTKESDPTREGDMGEGGRGSGQPWVTARPTASITVGHGQTHSQQRYGSSSFFSQNISLSLLNDKKKEEEEWERLSAGRKKWERRRNGRRRRNNSFV
jgi:hypothetical protein